MLLRTFKEEKYFGCNIFFLIGLNKAGFCDATCNMPTKDKNDERNASQPKLNSSNVAGSIILTLSSSPVRIYI